MLIDRFDFALPADLIARKPAAPRDQARLVLDTGNPGGEAFALHRFCDLPDLLQPGDMIVANNSRVIPSRLRATLGQGYVEVTLIRPLDEQGNHEPSNRWRALARPARKLRCGTIIQFDQKIIAEVTGRFDYGEVELRFDAGEAELLQLLEQHGRMALPPYLGKRSPAQERNDRDDYQTIYASQPGSIAAPTAGLHVTKTLSEQLRKQAIDWVELTLHVGPGTFLPVRVQDSRDHIMHPEWGQITDMAADRINEAKAKGRRIIALGTTSLRLLEAAANAQGEVDAMNGPVDLFITPGFHFQITDLLITNFHLPRSTLFMLIAAFTGLERAHALYRWAIGQKLHFYSYGDACILTCRNSGMPDCDNANAKNSATP